MKTYIKNIVIWLAAMTASHTVYGGEDVGVGFVKENGTTIAINTSVTDTKNSEIRCIDDEAICQDAFDAAFGEAMNSTDSSVHGWYSKQSDARQPATYRAIQIKIGSHIYRALENTSAIEPKNQLLWIDPAIEK